jgi:hypothetical protein
MPNLSSSHAAPALRPAQVLSDPHPSPAAQPVLFSALDPDTQTAVLEYLFDDDCVVEWSEEDVVMLHWRLLLELRDLCDPETPLEEKIDTLRWIFTDADKEERPFSFVSCLKVVGCSPLSPTPYFGLVDAEAVRDWIRRHVKSWFDATIARYPAWVRQAVLDNPGWVESRLAKNPQWINEEIKKHREGDLFA